MSQVLHTSTPRVPLAMDELAPPDTTLTSDQWLLISFITFEILQYITSTRLGRLGGHVWTFLDNGQMISAAC